MARRAGVVAPAASTRPGPATGNGPPFLLKGPDP